MPNKTVHHRVYSVLTIAGSDSGAASGIQADLKTFAAFGIHGVSAITAITAQNIRTVDSVQVLSADQVTAQLHTLSADFDIKAVKIGMLGSRANVIAVAAWLQDLRSHRGSRPAVVLDPVLISSSGKPLLADGALASLVRDLMPLADVLTPNLPEAEVLLQRPLATPRERRNGAHDLLAHGASAVLLKGGHAEGRMISDLLCTPKSLRIFRHARRPIQVRGTGCTLASAIAAGMALGWPLDDAVSRAQIYMNMCIRHAYRPGKSGIHVLDHLHRARARRNAG